MRVPSGDQVGLPGAKIGSCSFVIAPVATSITDGVAWPQMPSTSRKAIRLPSGDQLGPRADVVSAVTLRVVPAFMSRTQMFISGPPLSDAYASCVPSGDQAGSVSNAASCVRFTGLPPTGIAHTSPTAANATCFPSGEMTGRTTPSALRGARESKSRWRFT